jgi:hypothetical protein
MLSMENIVLLRAIEIAPHESEVMLDAVGTVLLAVLRRTEEIHGT